MKSNNEMLTITTDIIASSPMVPGTYTEHGIDQDLWQNIHSAHKTSKSDTTFRVCLGEIGVCVLMGFPCIFFGHFCFVNYLYRDEFAANVSKINNARYRGQPVLSTIGAGDLMVNVGMLRAINTTPANAQVITVNGTQPVVLQVVRADGRADGQYGTPQYRQV